MYVCVCKNTYRALTTHGCALVVAHWDASTGNKGVRLGVQSYERGAGMYTNPGGWYGTYKGYTPHTTHTHAHTHTRTHTYTDTHTHTQRERERAPTTIFLTLVK